MTSSIFNRYQKKVRTLYWFALCATLVFSLYFDHLEISAIDHLDKIKHFFAFFTLSFLLAMGWRLSTARSTVFAFAGLFIFGCFIELLQSFPMFDRTASIWDVLSNTIGVTLGLPAGILMRRI